MKKYILFIFTAFIFSSCANITGNGHIESEDRNVGDFNGVQVSGSFDADVTYGDKTAVRIEADDNILPYIVTEVHDGLLDVYFKENTSFSNVHAKVFVTIQNIKRLSVKGSGNLTSRNTLKSKSIETKISGSGDIDANVDAPYVKAEISGSGNLSLKGRCKTFEGSIGGSGDLKCKNLLSENASVNIAGSGTAHVFASVHLKTNIAGSGDIYYGGNPSVESNKAGSGTIKPER